MSTLEGLLDAIRADPDDEVLYLILADWLAEHGNEADQARGELIRVQWQLEKLPTGDPDRQDLEWWQRDLWWTHVEAWLGELYHTSTFTFRRGLVWLTWTPDCVDDLDLDHLADLPPWRWVVGLVLHGLTGDQVRTLARWRGLRTIVHLDLTRAGIGFPGLGDLLHSPNLESLKELVLAHTVTSVPQMTELGAHPFLGRLTSLDLSHNPVGSAGVAALTTSKHLGQLRRLNLAATGLGMSAVQALMASPLADQLKVLDVRDNRLNPHLVALLRQRLKGQVLA